MIRNLFLAFGAVSNGLFDAVSSPMLLIACCAAAVPLGCAIGRWLFMGPLSKPLSRDHQGSEPEMPMWGALLFTFGVDGALAVVFHVPFGCVAAAIVVGVIVGAVFVKVRT